MCRALYKTRWITPAVVLWKRFYLCVLSSPLGSPPTLTPDCVGGGCWVVGGGAFWEELQKAHALWAFISKLQLDAVHVGCLMANWCSMCKHTVSCLGLLLVATWVCLNMIPISTVNLVNSVKEKKKSVQPENQSKELLQVIEATMVGWSKFSCLNHLFSHFVYIALVILRNNLKYTEVTFQI